MFTVTTIKKKYTFNNIRYADDCFYDKGNKTRTPVIMYNTYGLPIKLAVDGCFFNLGDITNNVKLVSFNVDKEIITA